MLYRAVVLIGLLMVGVGCAPALDPIEQPIDASSVSAYNRWLYRTQSKLPPELRTRYDKAVQQLGLELSVANPISSSAQRSTEINRFLNGASARQVIAWVELLGLNRLALENLIDRDMLRANFVQQGNVREGSDRSIMTSIKNQIEAITARRNQRKQDIEKQQMLLAELMPEMPAKTWKPTVTETTDVPLKVLVRYFPTPSELRPPVTDE